jgi:hypothetical protein
MLDRKLKRVHPVAATNVIQHAGRMDGKCGSPIEVQIDVVFEAAGHAHISSVNARVKTCLGEAVASLQEEGQEFVADEKKYERSSV